jgi:DNA-binding transcriptional LysR family regulator
VEITLDQARALDAVARTGGFTKAAAELKKGHTGVIYLLKSLEQRLGLVLLDRGGYRTQLTPTGRLVWHECVKMLEAERGVLRLCAEMGEGWEAKLSVVFDGVLPVDSVIRVLAGFGRLGASTRVALFTEFLGGVEQKFEAEEAEMMVAVVPPARTRLKGIDLAPVRSFLVAHRDHPLLKAKGAATHEELERHVLLTVRGSDERLGMSTRDLDPVSLIHLSDFPAKKAAVLQKLGYGWLPEPLIQKELKRGLLRPVRWERTSVHVHSPVLYHRGERALGKGGRALLGEIVGIMGSKER